MPILKADAAEAEGFLRANPGITAIDLMFTNLCGVPRGKRLRTHELLPFYASGRFLPGSLQSTDTLGHDVPATRLVWEDGDADRSAWPAPGTLVPTPWAGPGAAQVIASLHELTGIACALDCRQILANAVDALAADGFTAVVACELEFYLLDPDANLPAPPVGMAEPQVYGLAELDRLRPFIEMIESAGDAAGLPIEATISEYAPGQFEIGLVHRDDALRACDEAMMFKRLVKGAAARFGHIATFMAKPFAETSGSGLHLHLSLVDDAGQNVFADDDRRGSPLLRHAIGGMRQFLPDMMAILAPGANSYRRYVAGSYAPVAATWGVNNRTVALRIPAGPPPSRHVEVRVAGADANPYLAAAAMLHAARRGIAERIDPGPETTGNGYAPDALAAHPAIPTDWLTAITRFEQSTFIAAEMGAKFSHAYATIKRHELDRYSSIVPPLDHAWYRDTA